MSATVRSWWDRYRSTLLGIAIALMVAAAVHRLSNEFWRLLFDPARQGAIDLKNFHGLVQGWFVGQPIYRERGIATFPPATWVILWPFLGWLPVEAARWFWAATTGLALAWLVYLVVRQSGATGRLELAAAALLPLSMYATSATIGNGQLIVHILPALLAALLLLGRAIGTWRGDLLAATLLALALVKPSVSVPFFWIALVVPGRPRPALLAAAGYVGLTLFAGSFQADALPALIRGWLRRASSEAARAGYANVHAWLSALGLEAWILPSSALILAAQGFWTYRHRSADIWLLLGVAGLVARLWTYHRLYDDLLILPAMIALFRIAKRAAPEDRGAVMAGALLAVTWAAALAPASLLSYPPPWSMIFATGQTIVWIAVLLFLVDRARRARRVPLAGQRPAGPGSHPAPAPL